jgi:hypothetical protein
MRCHDADHGSFPIAGVSVKQISMAIRKVVLAKPFFTLEKDFEVPPDQATSGRIEYHGVPVVSALQARPSVCGFEISLRRILHLLQ